MLAMNLNLTPPEGGSFRDLNILITGASAGIGRSLALHLAQLGATCLLLGRNIGALEAVYDEILEKGGPEPAIIPFDLSNLDPERLNEMVEAIADRYDALDALVHNAAILGDRIPFQQYRLTTWSQVFRINFDAPVALTQALLPLLQRSNKGAILFMSSSVGKQPRAYWGAYASSKYAVEGFAKLLVDELHNTSNIRVSIVNPGATRTKMRKAAYPAEDPSSVKPPADLMPLLTVLISPFSDAPRGHRFESNGTGEPIGEI